MEPLPIAGASEIFLRDYTRKDRPELERICIATGLSGRAEGMLTDKWLFAKLWLTPYLGTEPENAVVVDHAGEIKGYLVSGFNPNFKRRALWATLPWGVLLGLKYVLGFYWKSKEMRSWTRWVLFRSWREVPAHPHGSPHFHFNLDADVRGHLRLGDHLVREFERRVRAAGGDSWHTIVFSRESKRPASFYERLGFEIYASSPCSLFGDDTKYLTIVKQMGPETDMTGATSPQKRRFAPSHTSTE